MKALKLRKYLNQGNANSDAPEYHGIALDDALQLLLASLGERMNGVRVALSIGRCLRAAGHRQSLIHKSSVHPVPRLVHAATFELKCNPRITFSSNDNVALVVLYDNAIANDGKTQIAVHLRQRIP